MPRQLSDTDIERMRRSVAMLSPRHPSALDREAALELLAELQRLQRKDRRLRDLVSQVARVLEDEDSGQSL